MSELHIPDEAISAGWHELRYPRPATDEPGESFRRAVRTAAPIILAAAIRDRAAYYRDLVIAEENATAIALNHVKAEALDTWADELDGGTR